jgi:hypothetical protein
VDFGALTATLIGGIGSGNVTGIAFQPGTNILFGIDETHDTLITIDITTGSATIVGDLGVYAFDVGLAFDSSGNLFMTTDVPTAPYLYSVNPVTGAASIIGSTNTTGVVGLGFSPGGVLYGLVDTPGPGTTNTITGEATLVGELGFETYAGGIGFDGSGNLYGAFGLLNPSLTLIDSSTGTATTPTNLSINFRGLDFQGTSIPEPTTMLLFSIGLIGLAGMRRRFGNISAPKKVK